MQPVELVDIKPGPDADTIALQPNDIDGTTPLPVIVPRDQTMQTAASLDSRRPMPEASRRILENMKREGRRS